MRRGLLVAAIALGALMPAGAAAPSFVTQTLYHLDFPVSIVFTPDGRTAFISERSGRIRIAVGGRLRSKPFATVATTTAQERGLLGLAIDPLFAHGHPFVYAFHTTADGGTNQVERFRVAGEVASSRDVIMTLPGAVGYHNGGILAFGPDGKLYVSHGEAHDAARAQDPSVLGGKIYRINTDGSIPAGNPFGNNPTWAYGIRNPFGLAFNARGQLYETENGPNNHDEVNLIRRGGNYGWPTVRGVVHDSHFIDPIIDYVQIHVPTGIAVGAAPFPADLRGDLFFGTFGEGAIHRANMSADGTRVLSDTIIARDQIVGMRMGPDGLYYTTPTAVKKMYIRVIGGSQAPAKSSGSSASPSVSASPSPAAKRGGGSGLPLALLGGGLVAGLAIVFLRMRRG